MRHLIQLTSAGAALLLAACGSPASMDEQLQQDLQAASAGAMELAPRGSGTKVVVSAIEQNKPAQPRVTPVRPTTAPARTPPPEQPQATRTADPAATRPLTMPAPPKVQPCPAGGCKTVNEVIRNAPFPIKPATKAEGGRRKASRLRLNDDLSRSPLASTRSLIRALNYPG